MLSSIILFSNDAAAIEKTLRGIQGLATIAIGFHQQQHQHPHPHPHPQEHQQQQMIQEHVEMWIKLRAELALGRRYFRLLKWYPCWEIAWEKISAGSNGQGGGGEGGKGGGRGKGKGGGTTTTLRQMLEGMKYAFLGLYFFLEMLTITNALGVTHYSWGGHVQTEANKCWFYSIAISILLGLYSGLVGIVMTTTTTTRTTTRTTGAGEKKKNISSSDDDDGDDGDDDGDITEKKKKKEEKKKKNPQQQQQKSQTQQQQQQLIIDFADLIIPGAAIGWIPAGPMVVGIASTVSTLLTGSQIWKRVMREQQQQQKQKKQK